MFQAAEKESKDIQNFISNLPLDDSEIHLYSPVCLPEE
jgi:hypothetical protein